MSEQSLQCSARDCGDAAQWALLWNNPSIHDAQRRKVWLACEAHREHLSEFLSMRSMLRDVVPVDEIPEGVG